MEDSTACPRCKSTQYEKPMLKFMVNVCGHPLCEPCVEILFVRGIGACYTCKISLRKNNFRIQQFESAEVERYVEIRKRIAKDYNKLRSDFDTLHEYNDYLEEVETIAYNLTYDVDVEETKRRMERYKLENQEQIKKNRNKISPEEAELNRLIEEEELRHKTRMEQRRIAEENARIQREKKKMDLLNDFMFSDLPANKILMNHREVEEQEEKQKTEEIKKIEEKASKFSSGICIGKQENKAAPVMSTNGSLNLEDAEYSPLHQQMEGPDSPEEEELVNLNYLSKVRSVDIKEVGCGFRPVTFCSRALSDAYNGLFIFVDGRI